MRSDQDALPNTSSEPPSRIRTYGRILSYIKSYRGAFLLSLIATVLFAISQASLASLMQPLLDGTFIEKDPFYMRWIPIIIAGVFVLRAVTDFASNFGMAWVANNIMRDVRTQLFAHTLHLPDTTLNGVPSGRVQSIFIYNTQQMLSASTNVLSVLIKDSLVILGLIAFMFYQHWQLSSIILLLVPLIAYITQLINKRLKRLTTELQSHTGEIGQQVNEALSAHRELKIYRITDLALNRFDQANNKVRQTTMGVTRARLVSSQTTLFVTVLAMSGMIYAAIYFSNQGSLTVGMFISIFTAMAMLLSPIKRLTTMNELLQRGISAAEVVFDWIDQQAEPLSDHIQSDDQNIDTKAYRGDITLENVSVRYPDNEAYALRDISIRFPFGTTTALVGLSGGGKTTLMHLLPRLIEPSDGQIQFNGHDIKTINRTTLRRQISYVGQYPILFDTSIAENITLDPRTANDPKAQSRIQKALEDANAASFVQSLRDGTQTIIGPNGARLSGGQRQRLALARALYHDAAYLLLDEVTSALDASAEQQIQTALDQLHGQRTIIMIAHRLSTIRNADQIIVLDQGRVAERGTHDELIAHPGPYADLVAQQNNL